MLLKLLTQNHTCHSPRAHLSHPELAGSCSLPLHPALGIPQSSPSSLPQSSHLLNSSEGYNLHFVCICSVPLYFFPRLPWGFILVRSWTSLHRPLPGLGRSLKGESCTFPVFPSDSFQPVHPPYLRVPCSPQLSLVTGLKVLEAVGLESHLISF